MLSLKELAAYNSTYPKGEISCSKDRFVVNETLVFQIKFCLKCPTLWGSCKMSEVNKNNPN